MEKHQKHHTSLNEQSVITDAENAIDQAENAVQQVMSHPAKTSIQQAENAVAHAGKALHAAQGADDEHSVAGLNARYTEVRETLAGTQQPE